ncbi:MAG TPA: RDD family protein [Gemmatimonadaceae bacterium]|nr:RDD family protein [Gemmatimonadaceae bacterium]
MEQQNDWTDPAGGPGASGGQPEPPATEGIDDQPIVDETLSLTTAKADTGKRVVAAIIDCIVAAVLNFIPAIGGLAAAAYWLVRDGMEIDFMDRRSIGKKVMKLRPIRLDGQPMDIDTSVRRNWMFALGGVAWFLKYIPIFGWLLLPLVGIAALALGLYELFRVITDPQGRRLGDTMAGTKVIEVAD